MANAKLTIVNSGNPEQAAFDFNDKEYAVLYTQIDYLKAMNIYGQMEKIKNTNQNNWIENCEVAVNVYDEALRITKEMIGGVALSEILSIAGVKQDIQSITQILAACVAAISNKITDEKNKELAAEMGLLDNV